MRKVTPRVEDQVKEEPPQADLATDLRRVW
jgi:hypothetical protein